MTDPVTPNPQGDNLPVVRAPAQAQDDNNINYMEDADLGRQLSRLSAIHGSSIPAYRFGMVTATDEGVPLDNLKRFERALELWKAAFPQGQARRVLLDQVGRGEFPVLWISEDESRALVVRGPIVQGGFNAEDPQDNKVEVSSADLNTGYLLQLRTADEIWGKGEEKPVSATDWFSYALRKHRSIFVEAIIASVVMSFLGVASAMYTMQVYDRVIPHKGYETLVVLTVGVFIAIAFELIMQVIRANMTDRACKAIDLELSSVFFGKALDIRLDARPPTVGTFAAQVSHFEGVRNFLSSSTLYLFADIPLALFFIAIIATVAGWVAIVPLLIAPLALIAGTWFRKPIEKATQLNLEESHMKNGLLIEAVDGIESVKASGSGWKMLDRWRKLNEKAAESQLRLKLLTTYSSNLAKTIQQFTHVGIVGLGAYLVSIGDITMGALIACVIINGRAMTPIIQIPSMVVQWKNAKISLNVLDQIMAMPNDRDAEARVVVPDTCKGDLKVEGMSFSYRPDQPVINVPMLQVQAGERVAIVGPVGSGKSTLIKLVAGLYKPAEGSVSLDGIDMRQLDPEFVRANIGFLPQDVRLFNGTLRENLTLGLPSPSDTQILKAASLTGLAKAIQSNPRGLELLIAEGGRGLSGGQRQLVGLTRLLLAQPRIVLLDEPSASVDDALETRVMTHLFNELPKHSTVIIITHKLGLLQHVNRVVMLTDGKIVLDGPKDKIMEKIQQTRAKASPSGAEPAQGSGEVAAA